MAAVSSPCIRLCVLNDIVGLCEGCGRTRDEIAAWGRLAETERRAIMALLPQRMRRAGLPDAGADRSAGTGRP